MLITVHGLNGSTTASTTVEHNYNWKHLNASWNYSVLHRVVTKLEINRTLTQGYNWYSLMVVLPLMVLIIEGSIAANGDAAATNFNPFNTDINTVRGQETGYATLNVLDRSGGYNPTFKNGNLFMDGRGDGLLAHFQHHLENSIMKF